MYVVNIRFLEGKYGDFKLHQKFQRQCSQDPSVFRESLQVVVVMLSFSPNDRVPEQLVLRLHIERILGSEVTFGWHAVTHSSSVSVRVSQFYWNVANRL